MPEVKMAGICKSGPSSVSKFRVISWQVAAARTGVGGKSHRSAEQVAEGQGGRGHQKRSEERVKLINVQKTNPLLLQKVAQRHMHVLHCTSAMCINGDKSIWLKTRAGKPLKKHFKKSTHFKVYPLLTIA